MIIICAFYLLNHFLDHVFPITTEGFQQAHFSIKPNSVYIPHLSTAFLINLTSNSKSSLIRCAQKCSSYATCRTATYFQETQTCSLYNENSDVGQISNAVHQASFVLSMTDVQPLTCTTSAQSSWSVNAITAAGSPLGISGSSLSRLNTPIAVYYDQSYKRMIVGDYENERVLRFSLTNLSAGGVVIAGGNGYGCSLNQFASLVGVAMDSLRQLYTSDSVCDRIVRFPSNSNSATPGVIIDYVNTPQALFIHPLTDDLYVAVYGDHSVIKFNRNSSSSVIVAGGNGLGNNLNKLHGPISVYVDYLNTNSLYVADCLNHRILRFPPNSTSATYGTIVAGTNFAGSSPNKLNTPRAVFVDQQGILYITDKGNWRIQRWLPNATSGDTIAGGTPGIGPNQFNWIEALFFDEDFNLFVVDRGNNRIQLFNKTFC